jgi:competence ComEA-like helix-hairpin-helix protein
MFNFDPNAATESELLRLGLPAWTVRSILNYRAKGGGFRSKDDFRKIYNLKTEDYSRLEPYIVFSQIAASREAPRSATFSGGDSPKWATPKTLDINQAELEEWQRLPGIGEKRAQQIMQFRTALGGFVSVEQLGEMYGLPDSVFQKIRPMLVLAAGAVRKINLNAASPEELDKHPYISPKQAKLVVAYREQHGAFSSVDELTKIAAFTDKKWLEKLRPYLDIR